MWENGVTWVVMVTTLTNPLTNNGRTIHSVKKFVVPEYIIELLEGLPLSMGFGIKGDVLAIEDTFSLLAGRPVKLSGFVELGSLIFVCWVGFEDCEHASHTCNCVWFCLKQNCELC